MAFGIAVWLLGDVRQRGPGAERVEGPFDESLVSLGSVVGDLVRQQEHARLEQGIRQLRHRQRVPIPVGWMSR